MKLSHSKLSLMLKCPATYWLKYEKHLELRGLKSPALMIGSAVHWGIEHDTDNLDEFFQEELKNFSLANYADKQALAEGMVHGYKICKERLFDELLTDYEGNKAILYAEEHELSLTMDLPNLNVDLLKKYSTNFPFDSELNFLGIIDLLLVTDRGFIIVDYKTSSMDPSWDDYLDQIYRYIMLIQTNFPDTPIWKIAIINLKKSKSTRRASETTNNFRNRLFQEYGVDDNEYIRLHVYEPDKLDKSAILEYNSNFHHMCGEAWCIKTFRNFYINRSEIIGKYGKSDYYYLFQRNPHWEVFYEIKDTWMESENSPIATKRDCYPIDVEEIENVLFKGNDSYKYITSYESFKSFMDSYKGSFSLKAICSQLSEENYLFDEQLIKGYIYIFNVNESGYINL